MRAAFALRIISGKDIYNFAFGATAFAERSGAMKAPVGLLSDRAVLRSKMEGPRPDKLCGALQTLFSREGS